MVLTVAALGFTPRCARETEGEADPRVLRIARGLLTSKYSIHDLSRFQGEGEMNLARFNMPLELGMALGIRYLHQEEKRTREEERTSGAVHNWLALVPEHFIHQQSISDLAGYDALDHDQTPQKVIQRVANWLQVQTDFTPPAPRPKAILEAYPRFRERLAESREQALGTLTWAAITTTAEAVVAELPL